MGVDRRPLRTTLHWLTRSSIFRANVNEIRAEAPEFGSEMLLCAMSDNEKEAAHAPINRALRQKGARTPSQIW